MGLDLALAARRFQKDVRDDFFPDPLRYRDICERVRSDPDATIRVDGFVPSPAESWDVPKVSLSLRHCIQINPIDRVVYQALINEICEPVDLRLAAPVFSHRLRGPGERYMFRHAIAQFKEFEDAIRNSLTQGASRYLVKTDLAAYYENIRFQTLRGQLEQLLGPALDKRLEDILTALFACLKRWSPYQFFGLPQNMDPSSFLGNALLNTVDQQMLRAGWNYFRYMDDIRIVTRDEREARLALKELIRHLRKLELGVNSQKTSILGPDDEDMQEIIQPDDSFYNRIESAVGSKQRSQIEACVPLLWDQLEELLQAGQTGERKFRFCVNRMSALRRYKELEIEERESVSTGLLDVLVRRPADTDTICRYLGTVPSSDVVLDGIVRLLVEEPLCVYEWQNYHLWLLATQKLIERAELVQKAYSVLNGAHSDPEVAGASLYLGALGDYADRQKLEASYLASKPHTSRRAIFIAVQRAPLEERDLFYSRQLADDEKLRPLARHLEALDEPTYVPDLPPIEVDELVDDMPDKIS